MQTGSSNSFKSIFAIAIQPMRSLSQPKRRPTKRRAITPLLQEISVTSDVLCLPPGYSMHPSAQLIFSNGLRACNLTISNQHSSVQWRGDVDLRTLRSHSLRDLIQLGTDSVEVYPSPEATPRVGTELNKFCIATFFRGVDVASSKLSYGKCLQKLKSRCSKLGLELIWFDFATGEVKVGIPHFTKYALMMDSEGPAGHRRQGAH